MKKYKILRKGLMKKLQTFEDELNTHYKNGWRVVNVTMDSSGYLIALLERMDPHSNY